MAASFLRSSCKSLALVGLAWMSAGCTVLGFGMGSDADERHAGTPVAIAQASEIEHGTPLRVELPDGGNVRGFFLGMTALDSTGAAARRPALRLGVGNRDLTERMFAKGHMLVAPVTADVPDTLVFPLDRIRGLYVPEPRHGARTGAAVGAAVDLTLVTLFLASAGAIGLLAWLISR